MKKIIAMVPVRKGSQRVKSKNTRPFAGTTLLDLKLQVLKEIKGLDGIIVSTDCPVCIEIAKRHKVEVQIREEYYTSSYVTNDQHWRYIAEKTPGETVFMAQTTSPMVKLSTYQNAIDLYKSNDFSNDSINSVSPEKKFLWLDGNPVNYDPSVTPKSQDLPDIVSLNFAITLIGKRDMYERGNVVGMSPYFIVLDKVESVDVDDEVDFQFSEFLYQKYRMDWILG